MEYNQKYHPDKTFGNFQLRTRIRRYDEKIIAQELTDPYKIPDNPIFVLDIGSHIGLTALIAAKKGALVHCYEPNQDNFSVLNYNITRNNLNDKIKTFNYGVGKPGKTKLYLHPTASGTHSSFLQQKGLTDNNYEVATFISIRDVFYKNNYIDHCSLLKMDCEGSEVDIINDLDDDLAYKIKQISVEFHDKKLMPELIKKLEQWYTVEHLRRYEYAFYKK